MQLKFHAILRQTEKDLMQCLLISKQQQEKYASDQLHVPYQNTLAAITQLANADKTTEMLLAGWKADLDEVKVSVTLECTQMQFKHAQQQEAFPIGSKHPEHRTTSTQLFSMSERRL